MPESWDVKSVMLIDAPTPATGGGFRAGETYRIRLSSSEETTDLAQFVTESAMGVIAHQTGPMSGIARHEILAIAVEEFLLAEFRNGWNPRKNPSQAAPARKG